jgi:tetratricopeptide (TPR) repeat protein
MFQEYVPSEIPADPKPKRKRKGKGTPLSWGTRVVLGATFLTFAAAYVFTGAFNQILANVLFELGRRQYEVRNYDLSIDLLTRAMDVRSDQARFYYYRGMARSWSSRQNEALGDFARAVELDPNKADHFFWRGATYAWKHEQDPAIADYNRAIALKPNVSDYYRWRALAYAFKGQHSQAIIDFNRAIELTPKKALYLCERGKSYAQKNEHTIALADYSHGISLDPKLVDCYRWRAESHHVQKNYAAEADDYTRVLESHSDKGFLFYTRGMAFKLSGNIERAIADFKQAADQGYEEARKELKAF